MLSDGALADAVGCEIKWLYNSSSRLKRPLERTHDAAIWWRLVHLLTAGLHIPLADAARAAELFLKVSPDTGRVRLAASLDPSIAVSIDVGKFHDGSALALARAVHHHPPRKRGRPAKHGTRDGRLTAAVSSRPGLAGKQLQVALASMRRSLFPDAPEFLDRFLGELGRAGAAPVLAGEFAANVRGASSGAVTAVDLVCDITPGRSRGVAEMLNLAGARPRGIAVRRSFHMEPETIVRTGFLALSVAGAAVNIQAWTWANGAWHHGPQDVEQFVVGSMTYSVLSDDAARRMSRP